MTTFPDYPRLIKGALVGMDPLNPLASVVVHDHSDGQVSNGRRQPEEKELRVGWIGRKERMTEAEVTEDREQATQASRQRQKRLSPFLYAEEGVLIGSPCWVEIKPEGDELIEHWLQPVDDAFQSSLNKDPDGSHDGETFAHGQCSDCDVIHQQQRGVMDKRGGDHDGLGFRDVRRDESVDHMAVGHLPDSDPLILEGLLQFHTPSATRALNDHFFNDLWGDKQVLKESLEEEELFDCRKVNEGATIRDDNHVGSCDCVRLNTSNSLSNHPTSYSTAGILCSAISVKNARRDRANNSAPFRQEICSES